RTSALHLTNRQYVYRTSSDAGSLVVALNVDDSTLRKSLSEFGIDSGRVVAGSGVPAEDVVVQLEVEPHGWAVLTV
ncbi:MAG: cyclomaltodextrinase / maltogenic alpha-amylase / neopullulanase, partial [Mycobacterium sp.]|nr:cyclomaltodextrinase / maltogenic alpha-amylase / neopullulanase [Mycobacterium sp.]